MSREICDCAGEGGRGCAAGCVKRLCSLRSGGRQPPSAAEGGGIALSGDEYICRLRRQENLYNRASPAGNAPLLPTAPLHGKSSHVIFRSLCSLTNHVRLPPRRGRFTLRSAFELISILRHSTAKTSPSGGSGAQHQKGCISSGEARLYGFLSVTAINSN